MQEVTSKLLVRLAPKLGGIGSIRKFRGRKQCSVALGLVHRPEAGACGTSLAPLPQACQPNITSTGPELT